VKEVFLDSETDVAVISGVPSGVLLPPETMAATRDLVNAMAGAPRALSQAMIDPKERPGTPTALDSLDHQVETLGAKGLKCYTYNGDWWLDDEQVSYPMLEAAAARGITLVNCHKGLPNLTFFPNSGEYVRTRDLPKAVRDWPQLNFCAYHAGYFPEERGNSEFLRVAKSLERRHRRNLYAEIGSSFAIALLDGGPRHAALFVGKLLRVLGSRNVLWGTDSIWWGSPQWLIDAFKMLRIPADLRERHRLPALTRRVKARILGLNAARLYGVDPAAARGALATDRIARARATQGGHRAARSLRTYGPRTRREFLALLRRSATFV
jgi:predicted TIM-barrel fold metal-dependent hydrolase